MQFLLDKGVKVNEVDKKAFREAVKPMVDEYLSTAVTNKGYYSLGVGFFEKRNVARGIEKISLDTDSDAYYPVFVRETLNEFINRKTPTANQNHIYRVRKILDRIIEKAKSE